MIKAVIFDMGGVLVRTVDPSLRAAAERAHGLAAGEAEQLVMNSPAGRDAQHGRITTEELWAQVQSQLALDDDALAAFRHAFWAGDQLDVEMVELIRTLKHKGYQTALLSNFMDELREIVTTRYPMADAFDLIMGSCYEGIMKPEAEIFRRILTRLGRQPEEAVFIDDFLHNVEGARAVGMHAIHYTPGLDVAAALAQLGVVA
ncbi:MAG: HAD family phosphatase [Caldilineaceae bacterium]|nr:HAD family phosphatase [Caldilineaceae bacterium]